ncbi:MAG: hypothetical protein ACREM2_02060 [Vulcanimicrobiaceae bacterium]
MLETFTAYTGSQAATFWTLGSSEIPQHSTFMYINFDPALIPVYVDQMAALDPTAQYVVAHPHEPIVHDGLVISESEKERHPYYDWHGRYSETRFRLVSQTRPHRGVQAGIALHRTRRAGRYEPSDIERFGVLHEHLRRALAIAFRIGSLGAMRWALEEWLDRSSAAILFLDSRKRPVFCNRAARALHAACDGVVLGGDGLALAHRADNDRLARLLAGALSPLASAGGSQGGAMRAQRPSGKRPYGILVSPVSKTYPGLCVERPAACGVITDPDRRELVPAKRFQAALGLTGPKANSRRCWRRAIACERPPSNSTSPTARPEIGWLRFFGKPRPAGRANWSNS